MIRPNKRWYPLESALNEYIWGLNGKADLRSRKLSRITKRNWRCFRDLSKRIWKWGIYPQPAQIQLDANLDSDWTQMNRLKSDDDRDSRARSKIREILFAEERNISSLRMIRKLHESLHLLRILIQEHLNHEHKGSSWENQNSRISTPKKEQNPRKIPNSMGIFLMFFDLKFVDN